jgi:hypothetical protein
VSGRYQVIFLKNAWHGKNAKRSGTIAHTILKLLKEQANIFINVFTKIALH